MHDLLMSALSTVLLLLLPGCNARLLLAVTVLLLLLRKPTHAFVALRSVNAMHPKDMTSKLFYKGEHTHSCPLREGMRSMRKHFSEEEGYALPIQ